MWRAGAVALFATIAVMGIACGGDDDEGDDVADASEPTSAATSEATTESSSGDAAGSSGGGSCDLLTIADLTDRGIAATGEPTPNELSPSDECRYGEDAGVVVIVYTENEATALGPTLYQGTEVVDGIGEEAWYVESFGLMQVRLADGRVISISDETDLDDPKDVLIELADVAAGRS